jgi:hypothetical protein
MGRTTARAAAVPRAIAPRMGASFLRGMIHPVARPRQPILAAISAALLLLAAAIAVRGQFRWDILTFNAGPRALILTNYPGTVAVAVHAIPLGSPAFDWSSGEEDPEWPWWSWRWIGRPTGGELVMPMWAPALLPAVGLWWGWRRRRDRVPAAFPVEPAAAPAT